MTHEPGTIVLVPGRTPSRDRLGIVTAKNGAFQILIFPGGRIRTDHPSQAASYVTLRGALLAAETYLSGGDLTELSPLHLRALICAARRELIRSES